jgi:hypothetical protein
VGSRFTRNAAYLRLCGHSDSDRLACQSESHHVLTPRQCREGQVGMRDWKLHIRYLNREDVLRTVSGSYGHRDPRRGRLPKLRAIGIERVELGEALSCGSIWY